MRDRDRVPAKTGKPAGTFASHAAHIAPALACVLAVGAAPAAAQDATPPRPLQQSQPNAPTNPMGIPLEGWVKLRYSVTADGKPADVRIVDVMPPQLSTRGIVSAVESWTFEPATAGGQPVEWHNNESIVVFDHEQVPLEPSPRFAQAYVEVNNLMGEQDYNKALKQNQSLLETRAFRLNEIGLLQAQAAILHVAMQNPHDAYEAIVRSTEPQIQTLDDPALAEALRYRFGIEVELGRYGASLETYERLIALEDLPDDDVVKQQAEALRGALAGDGAVDVKGRVDRGGPWTYTPVRRAFGFTNVDGSIRGLELECNRRKTELEFSADVEWAIPESWGDCLIVVNARRNTTFSLIELPPAP